MDISKPIEIKQLSSLEGLLEELKKLYLEAYGEDYLYAYRDPKRVKRYLRWLLKHSQGGFWVAFCDDVPIGFLALQPDCRFQRETVPEIHELVVSPLFQGKNIAYQLMQKAFSFLKKKGYTKVALWVGEKNERAKQFYRHMGFKETARQGAWIRMETHLDLQDKSSKRVSNTQKASTTSLTEIHSPGV